MDQELTDEEIVSLIKDGDKEKFSQLYLRYIDRIYRLSYFKLRNKEDAEDVTSKTFLNALKSIGSFREDSGSFSSWLYQITRNLIQDKFRLRPREVALDENLELPYHQGIENNIDIAKNLKELDKVLNELEDEQKDIIIMRLWDEMPFKEIAETLNKNESATKMSFYRGLEKIKQALIIMILALGKIIYITQNLWTKI